MMAESGMAAKILSWLKPVKLIGQWIIGVFRLKSRVDELERRLAEPVQQPPQSPHRKCPKCGERDFRLHDQYRARPDVFGPRFLHQKWLCYSCGHAKTDNIEEPD